MATVNVVLAYILVVAIVGWVLAALVLRLREMGKSERRSLGGLIGVFAVMALVGFLSLLFDGSGELIMLLILGGGGVHPLGDAHGETLSYLLRHQPPIGEVSSVDDAPERVREDVGVFAVVVPPLQFLQVAVQVLDAHLVEGADNGPLEQAPYALDRVGVNLTHNPLFLGVFDRLVAGVVIAMPM